MGVANHSTEMSTKNYSMRNGGKVETLPGGDRGEGGGRAERGQGRMRKTLSEE